MSKSIPDRWLDYKPMGERIPGTRFVAFKVPLKQHTNQLVKDQDKRLDIDTLIECMPNLGLIIDLTNTNRYYDAESVLAHNVEHRKLMIPGHQTPPKHLSKQFCRYVLQFMQDNMDNDKLIGVHCTHGVNRTGYLICYFMITALKMSPEDSINAFMNARGHPIERSNYISALMHLTPTKVNFRNPNHTHGYSIWRHGNDNGYRKVPNEGVIRKRSEAWPSTPVKPGWRVEVEEYQARQQSRQSQDRKHKTKLQRQQWHEGNKDQNLQHQPQQYGKHQEQWGQQYNMGEEEQWEHHQQRRDQQQWRQQRQWEQAQYPRQQGRSRQQQQWYPHERDDYQELRSSRGSRFYRQEPTSSTRRRFN